MHQRVSQLVAVFICLLATGVSACEPGLAAVETEAVFSDVAAEVGLDFAAKNDNVLTGVHELRALTHANLGTGAAVGDIDDDGDLDIYLLGTLGQKNRLFRNDVSEGEKRFVDITESARVGDIGLSRLANFADLDNDGDLDLIVLNDDDGTNLFSESKIFRNDGATFVDVTADSGFRPTGLPRCGMAIADIDHDGLLDIYATNWGVALKESGGKSVMYKNLGGLQFEDITEQSGLSLAQSAQSFSAIFSDFDGNGDADLFVAIDVGRNAAYFNDNGTFTEAAAATGLDHEGNDMGIAAGDIDNDGDLDLFTSNIADPTNLFGFDLHNALLVNESSGSNVRFQNESLKRGVGDSFWAWGTEFTDVDNDGDLDLIVVGGNDEVVSRYDLHSPLLDAPSILFLNDGTGVYSRSTGTALDSPRDSRALIAFDYDRDGDEDLLVTNVNQPVQLLENQAPTAHSWLQVSLRQRAGLNSRGVGAVLYVKANGVTQRRDIILGESYLAGVPAEVHLGLGSAAAVDELRVVWSSGEQSIVRNVKANQHLTVHQ